MDIQGYKRENGTYGVRNHLIILPTSVCASETATSIAQQVPGAIALPHQHGCCQVGDDFILSMNTLIGMGKNPNVGAVLVIGLGCEGIRPKDVAEEIATTGKPVDMLVIQEHGGTLGTIQEGVKIASRMARELSQIRKVTFPISEIILGLECGGSDPTSGLASNPTIGECSNLLIADGGSSLLSETTEMIGAEHIFARRAVTKEIGDKFIKMVEDMENKAIEMGHDLRGSQPTPGNIEGGITTIEEKSLGCIYKAGDTPLLGAIGFAEMVPSEPKGLYFMDTPGEDICSITGMVAGGCQVIVFSTGLGTPTGSPIAPVIKITGNNDTYHKMTDNIDINAGTIITEGVMLEEKGKELYDEMVDVCNGKLTKAESLGHKEFGLYRIGYTF